MILAGILCYSVTSVAYHLVQLVLDQCISSSTPTWGLLTFHVFLAPSISGCMGLLSYLLALHRLNVGIFRSRS